MGKKDPFTEFQRIQREADQRRLEQAAERLEQVEQSMRTAVDSGEMVPLGTCFGIPCYVVAERKLNRPAPLEEPPQ